MWDGARTGGACHTKASRVHLPHASGNCAARPGSVPDLRYGAGAAHGQCRSGRKSGTARHDPALLDQPRADGAAAWSRHGRHVTGNAGAACTSRRRAAVDRIAACYSCGALGRMAVFPARLDFGRKPLHQYVHADRHGDWRRIRVQRCGHSGAGNFSRIVSRDEWNAPGVFRGRGGDHDFGAARTSSRTAGARQNWRCNSRFAGPHAKDGPYCA